MGNVTGSASRIIETIRRTLSIERDRRPFDKRTGNRAFHRVCRRTLIEARQNVSSQVSDTSSGWPRAGAGSAATQMKPARA